MAKLRPSCFTFTHAPFLCIDFRGVAYFHSFIHHLRRAQSLTTWQLTFRWSFIDRQDHSLASLTFHFLSCRTWKVKVIYSGYIWLKAEKGLSTWETGFEKQFAMSESRKNHLTIDGGQAKEDDHVASYKPIPESDTGNTIIYWIFNK